MGWVQKSWEFEAIAKESSLEIHTLERTTRTAALASTREAGASSGTVNGQPQTQEDDEPKPTTEALSSSDEFFSNGRIADQVEAERRRSQTGGALFGPVIEVIKLVRLDKMLDMYGGS